ncbi:MAG: DUF1573 domain-containing protein [Aureispira sp.]|nr:DUF1573 domain-containing protein [Aureispira sp.]
MKTFISSTILLFCLCITNNLSAQEITFETQKIDYGTITQGANGERHFSFTNTGAVPLIIQNAQKSCGCTIPTWPKEPILPGETSKIKVKYDTNRLGNFTKYVTITSNDPKNPTIRLNITGVIEKEIAATPAKEATVFK